MVFTSTHSQNNTSPRDMANSIMGIIIFIFIMTLVATANATTTTWAVTNTHSN
jgi:hypothetical protein